MLGRTKPGMRSLIPGFTLNRGDCGQLVKGFARWGWLEMTEGWRSWGADEERMPVAETGEGKGRWAQFPLAQKVRLTLPKVSLLSSAGGRG